MAEYRRMKVVGSSSDGAAQAALAALGGCVVVLSLLVYGVVTTGWVLTVLWGWFVEQTFHLPPLLLPAAVGIAAMVRLLTYVDTSKLEQKQLSAEDRWLSFAGALATPWVALSLGWIAHLFV